MRSEVTKCYCCQLRHDFLTLSTLLPLRLVSLIAELGGAGAHDIGIASDCIYYPDAHSLLLESASVLIKKGGYLVVVFSLHGNCPESDTLGFFELATKMGWEVENELSFEHEVQKAAEWSSVKGRGNVYIKVLKRV